MGRLVALATLLLLLAVSVSAHGILERTEPRANGTVATPPSHVRLWFTGALEPAYSRVRVEDERGARVDLGDSAVDGQNRALLRVSVPALAAGRYKVVWRVLSVDSHVTEGTFSFSVKP